MVSSYPTFSGKLLGQRVPRSLALPVVAATVFFTVALFSYPWEILLVMVLVYVGALPFGYRSYQRQLAHESKGEET